MRVKKLYVKKHILLALLIVSFLSFSLSSAKISFIANDEYTDFYFSDNIVPGEELIWNVAKFDKEPDVDWTIKSGYLIEEGDILKFEITVDPDYLILTSIEELQFTSQEWADFYLNSDYLGNDSSALNFYVQPFESEFVFWYYLLPVELDFPTGIVNTFDYLYDMSEPLEYDNSSGSYEVELTSDLFNLNWEYHFEGDLFFLGHVKTDRIFEISYNLEWGNLDRLKIYESVNIQGEKEVFELVLLNSRSTQKVSLNWYTGFIALFIIGIAVIYIRRR